MTAEEFLNDKYQNDLNSYQDNVESLIEFAKHHVAQALKEIYEQNEEILDKSFIINSYPLTNIK